MSDEQGMVGTVMTGDVDGADDAVATNQATEQNTEQNSAAGDQPADDAKDADNADGADTQDKKAEGDDADDQGAPDEYADFDIPEGVTVADADVDSFKGLAKELGLRQDQAQKLMTFEAMRIQALNDHVSGQHVQQVQDWAANAKTDKEFGGDAFTENVGIAKQAMQAFASEEAQALLDSTGLGSHPEIIRMFWKMGRATASDGAVTGGNAAPPAADARAMFPNSNHN